MVLSSTAESTAFSCSMAAAAGHLFSALEHRSPPPASLPEGGVGAGEGSRSACPPKEQTRAGAGVDGHTGAQPVRKVDRFKLRSHRLSSFIQREQVHPRQMSRRFMEESRPVVIFPSAS